MTRPLARATWLALWLAGVGSNVALAQPAAAPPRDPAPPVLSTVPIPPAGAQPQPGSMSGLPLQVGDLPPGTVAVRVVRQPFANVTGQSVELKIGADAKTRTAITGANGRAQFSGLTIGEHVIATAVVDGERLESQLFPLPAQGGVRVLLLAGEGRGAAAAREPSASAAPPPIDPGERGPSRTAMILVGLFAATGLGVWWSASRGTRSAAAAPAATSAPTPSRAAILQDRERLYAELVAIDLAREQGPGPAESVARRETLIRELEAVYAQLGESPPR